MSALAAAAYARTDRDFYPWYAPAGLTRGKLNSVIKLAINPNQKQRDQLYRINANPIMFDSNEGFVIMGQKTGQRKPTALQSINVRRQFNWFKKNFKKVSRYFVMEQNTAITRNRFVAALDPYLSLAKNNEGVYDYQIRCDSSNNTPDTIDALEMKASVYVKPTRAAEYVLIDLVATKTGASFNEIS
jgi:phage tail sheath protein FI